MLIGQTLWLCGADGIQGLEIPPSRNGTMGQNGLSSLNPEQHFESEDMRVCAILPQTTGRASHPIGLLWSCVLLQQPPSAVLLSHLTRVPEAKTAPT